MTGDSRAEAPDAVPASKQTTRSIWSGVLTGIGALITGRSAPGRTASKEGPTP